MRSRFSLAEPRRRNLTLSAGRPDHAHHPFVWVVPSVAVTDETPDDYGIGERDPWPHSVRPELLRPNSLNQLRACEESWAGERRQWSPFPQCLGATPWS